MSAEGGHSPTFCVVVVYRDSYKLNNSNYVKPYFSMVYENFVSPFSAGRLPK